MLKKASQILPGLVLAAAVLLVSPWVMTDPDALTNLAVGRYIHQAGAVPAADPFTFSARPTTWSNPEWFGSLIWYGAYRLGGEGALQGVKLSLLVLAWLLLWLLAVRGGAGPWLTLALLLVLLPGTAWRFTLRNHLHTLWLVPLYGLFLQATLAGSWRRWLPALIPLGILWANLHSSFVIGWVLLAAALAGALARGDKPLVRALAAVLALHPLLALVSPHGLGNYSQLMEHLQQGVLLRGQIQEWRAPAQTLTLTARAPLLLMLTVGVLSFLPPYNRKDLRAPLLLLFGLAAAMWAQRFIPLLVFLAAPRVSLNLTRILARFSRPTARLALGLTLVMGVLTLLQLAKEAHGVPLDPLLLRPGTSAPAARFMARHAPAGTRLFNSYNSGPFFLWIATPGTRLYIDPRNNLGMAHLRRYLVQLLPHPARFEREAQALGVSLAHVNLAEERMRPLAAHLGRSPRWVLVYFDGYHALFARRVIQNAPLILRFELLKGGRGG